MQLLIQKLVNEAGKRYCYPFLNPKDYANVEPSSSSIPPEAEKALAADIDLINWLIGLMWKLTLIVGLPEAIFRFFVFTRRNGNILFVEPFLVMNFPAAMNKESKKKVEICCFGV